MTHRSTRKNLFAFAFSLAGVALPIAILASASTPALGQGDPTTRERPAEKAAVTPQTAKVLATVRQINRGEVEIGRLGEKRGSTQAVKDYARMLVRDHSRAETRLVALAAKLQVNLEGQNVGPIPELENLYAVLERSQGGIFDAELAEGNVDAHRHAIAKLQAAEPEIENREARAYVHDLIPVLEKHLHEAERLRDKVAGR